MSDDPSYEEFVLGAYKALLVDCALQYPRLAKEFDRDYLRLCSALEHHGIHFFLDVMPSYRKHLDRCLDEKRLIRTNLVHFGSWFDGGTIPRLFRGLFLRVFELNGDLRDQPDDNAISLLRQLLGAVRRMRMSSSKLHTCNAVDSFFREDQEVHEGDRSYWSSSQPAADHERLVGGSFSDLNDHRKDHQRDCSQSAAEDQLSFDLGDESYPSMSLVPTECLTKIQQVADLFSGMLGRFSPYEWHPKHGPGAVADHEFGAYKYAFDSWPSRLEQVFPYADFAYANYAVWVDSCRDTAVPCGNFYHEVAARLHAVPKTLTKPRLIAAEPTCLQWCQQAIKDYFYHRVSDTVISNFVDFRRQDLNGQLALEASHLQSHATIDLSSASDRVSCWHVERLFRRAPTLLDALRATRSLWIKQDISRTSPRLYRLRKYSTMGNATTFPVQTLLFASMALGTLCYKRGLNVNLATLRKLGKSQVRVFGDDIIVPDDVSRLLVRVLEAFSMKVNLNKTFLNGQFRESCGVDAYDGHDVTTTSILDLPRRTAPGSIVSSVDVHHNLLSQGYYATAAYIRKIVGLVGYQDIRTVKHGSGFFGWSDMCDTPARPLRTRWNSHLHVSETRCLRLKVKAARHTSVDEHGLLQFFTEAASKVTSATSSLGYLARRPKVTLCLGWERNM